MRSGSAVELPISHGLRYAVENGRTKPWCVTPQGRWNRFVRRDPDGCWRWTGHLGTGSGYGVLGLSKNRHEYAHRLSYQWHKGPIPDGFQIDHLCRVRECVNPDHLEAVTQAENIRRAFTGFCKRGHDLSDPAHQYIRPDTGRRQCRTCNSLRYQERKAA